MKNDTMQGKVRNMTWLLFVDELNGFAKSSLMLAMWIGTPLIGIGLYFATPHEFPINTMGDTMTMPATGLLATMISVLVGSLAATILAVEIVNERTKKVYDLFLIRPIKRSSFMWAKFFAVTFCVSIAFILSMIGGVIIDAALGVEMSPELLKNTLTGTLSGVGVVAVSAASGVLIGMISNTVLMAVLLVLFLAQYVMLIPALAALLPFEWVQVVSLALTVVITVAMMLLASLLFQRMET
jgi:ABC-2 type transport system permease protein